MLCHHQIAVLCVLAPRGHILSFFAPPPPHSPHRRNPAYAALFRIRLYALILVFPACAIEVQHNNQNSPTIHCNKQSHINHLNQSVYLLFHSDASETQAAHKTFKDEIVAGIY